MGQLENNHTATLDDDPVQGNNTIILNTSEINGMYR